MLSVVLVACSDCWPSELGLGLPDGGQKGFFVNTFSRSEARKISFPPPFSPVAAGVGQPQLGCEEETARERPGCPARPPLHKVRRTRGTRFSIGVKEVLEELGCTVYNPGAVVTRRARGAPGRKEKLKGFRDSLAARPFPCLSMLG